MAQQVNASRPRFAPVARKTVSEEIRQTLFDSVQSGTLLPGQQLPSERELCDEFGVGRTTVREALQGLLTLGAVERRGHRLYVRERVPNVTLASIDSRKDRVRELFEVRRVFEVSIARLCVQRATSAGVDQICAVARTFSPNMPLEQFRQQDEEFHTAIAQNCGNPTLVELYQKVLDTLFASDEFSSLLSATSNQRTVRQIIREAGAAHRQISEGILQRDEDAVVAATGGHLDHVEKLMLGRMV